MVVIPAEIQLMIWDYMPLSSDYRNVNRLAYRHFKNKFNFQKQEQKMREDAHRRINLAAARRNWDEVEEMIAAGVDPSFLLYSVRRVKANYFFLNEDQEPLRRILGDHLYDQMEPIKLDRSRVHEILRHYVREDSRYWRVDDLEMDLIEELSDASTFYVGQLGILISEAKAMGYRYWQYEPDFMELLEMGLAAGCNIQSSSLLDLISPGKWVNAVKKLILYGYDFDNMDQSEIGELPRWGNPYTHLLISHGVNPDLFNQSLWEHCVGQEWPEYWESLYRKNPRRRYYWG